MQAARLLKVSRERDSMLRNLGGRRGHQLGGGGSTSEVGTGSEPLPHEKQQAAAAAAAADNPSSYVMCTIDGLTYILNPEAEIVIRAGKARATVTKVT